MGLRITKILNGEAATAAVARSFARDLKAGDVLLLSGPIGAGKSTFARALVQERMAQEGRHEEVPSPTFTLVQTYLFKDLEIWHADLYRLGDASELVELGLEDAFENAACLVEWPDRLERAPGGALHIDFAVIDAAAARQVTMHSEGGHWLGRLDLASVAAGG